VDPATSTDSTGWFQWLVNLVVLALGAIGWNTMNRVSDLEKTSQTRGDADEVERQMNASRESLRKELREDIINLGDKMDEQHSKLYDKIESGQKELRTLILDAFTKK